MCAAKRENCRQGGRTRTGGAHIPACIITAKYVWCDCGCLSKSPHNSKRAVGMRMLPTPKGCQGGREQVGAKARLPSDRPKGCAYEVVHALQHAC